MAFFVKAFRTKRLLEEIFQSWETGWRGAGLIIMHRDTLHYAWCCSPASYTLVMDGETDLDGQTGRPLAQDSCDVIFSRGNVITTSLGSPPNMHI